MRFLFIAPRFHTNLTPIISGLIGEGNEVQFGVRYVGPTEEHNGVIVKTFRPSFLSDILCRIFQIKSDNYAESKMFFWFMPQKTDVKKCIHEYKPDVIILRNRNLFSLRVYSIACKYPSIKCILYNQSPLYSPKYKRSRVVIHNQWRKIFPKTRITPCQYRAFPKPNEFYDVEPNSYFLPFVYREANIFKENYAQDGIVRFFDSGKYREYKNHFCVVDAIERIVQKGIYSFHVTIQGQVSNQDEDLYYNSLREYIEKKKLNSFICLRKQVPYNEMGKLFLEHDVFILPSYRELANVSILDAMAYGLAVISTDNNGTANYIEPGICGQIFESNNPDSLAEKMTLYIQNPQLVETQGKSARKHVLNVFSFESYYKKLQQVLDSF